MFTQMTSSPPNGAGLDITNATEAILNQLEKTADNNEFLESLTDSA